MKEIIEKRLLELVGLSDATAENPVKSATHAYQIYFGTLSIASLLYGKESQQVEELKSEKRRIAESKWGEIDKFSVLIAELKGVLLTFIGELKLGLVEQIENEARGDIYADFIALSKDCLEKGTKEVASVLICAALEDSLKNFAESNGLNVEDNEMSKVINQLKSRSLLKKAEAKILQSYVTLRNKSFHAEWDKIGEPEVSSAIGFVERFILKQYSGSIHMQTEPLVVADRG